MSAHLTDQITKTRAALTDHANRLRLLLQQAAEADVTEQVHEQLDCSDGDPFDHADVAITTPDGVTPVVSVQVHGTAGPVTIDPYSPALLEWATHLVDISVVTPQDRHTATLLPCVPYDLDADMRDALGSLVDDPDEVRWVEWTTIGIGGEPVQLIVFVEGRGAIYLYPDQGTDEELAARDRVVEILGAPYDADPDEYGEDGRVSWVWQAPQPTQRPNGRPAPAPAADAAVLPGVQRAVALGHVPDGVTVQTVVGGNPGCDCCGVRDATVRIDRTPLCDHCVVDHVMRYFDAELCDECQSLHLAGAQTVTGPWHTRGCSLHDPHAPAVAVRDFGGATRQTYTAFPDAAAAVDRNDVSVRVHHRDWVSAGRRKQAITMLCTIYGWNRRQAGEKAAEFLAQDRNLDTFAGRAVSWAAGERTSIVPLVGALVGRLTAMQGVTVDWSATGKLLVAGRGRQQVHVRDGAWATALVGGDREIPTRLPDDCDDPLRIAKRIVELATEPASGD